jgi:hypothetical protein
MFFSSAGEKGAPESSGEKSTGLGKNGGFSFNASRLFLSPEL